MHYLSSDNIERALAFVQNGGIWVVGPLTGGRTENHTIHTDAALGELEQLAGIETLFMYPMEGSGTIGQAFGVSAPLGMWSAVFEPKEAIAVGVLAGGLTPGKAFITEHKLGNGKIVMLGSIPLGEDGDLMLKKLIDHYAVDANIMLRTDVTIGTIVAPRQGDGNNLWIIINMDGKGAPSIFRMRGMTY